MSNLQIANILFNVATILDEAQDNPYRVRAYRHAARRVLALGESARAILARGEELPLPGVGTRMRRKLAELIATGQLGFYEELLEDQPEHVRSLLRIEGVGPKIAERLYQGLGISTPEGVLAAAQAGAIRTLYGFGERREASLAYAASFAAGTLSCVA